METPRTDDYITLLKKTENLNMKLKIFFDEIKNHNSEISGFSIYSDEQNEIKNISDRYLKYYGLYLYKNDEKKYESVWFGIVPYFAENYKEFILTLAFSKNFYAANINSSIFLNQEGQVILNWADWLYIKIQNNEELIEGMLSDDEEVKKETECKIINAIEKILKIA